MVTPSTGLSRTDGGGDSLVAAFRAALARTVGETVTVTATVFGSRALSMEVRHDGRVVAVDVLSDRQLWGFTLLHDDSGGSGGHDETAVSLESAVAGVSRLLTDGST